MNQILLNAVRYFTRETRMLTALSVTCGDGQRSVYAEEGTGPDTLYDLASVTKLMAGFCAMRLREEGRLDLAAAVGDYDARFTKLRDVVIGDLMSFRVSLQTEGRVDACPDRGSALECLFGTYNAGEPGPRPYSDIPAMVLKYIIESVTGEPLYECIRRMILLPAGMTETYARVPPERVKDCMLYEPEFRIEKGRYIKRAHPRGIPHDPKAVLISPDGADLCGHAGLFSTRRDMVRFCRAVLNGRILSEDSLRELAVNRTGRRLPDGSYTQHLGYMCSVRNPIQYFSELPPFMSGSAFAIPGFTGNHVCIDPEKKLFILQLGNRVRDRLTVCVPEDGKMLADYGLNEDGSGRIVWPDGTPVISTVKYVHKRDDHLYPDTLDVIKEENFGSGVDL